MKSKIEIGSKLEDYLETVRKILGNKEAKIEFIRTNGRTEYLIECMKEIYEKEKGHISDLIWYIQAYLCSVERW